MHALRSAARQKTARWWVPLALRIAAYHAEGTLTVLQCVASCVSLAVSHFWGWVDAWASGPGYWEAGGLDDDDDIDSPGAWCERLLACLMASSFATTRCVVWPFLRVESCCESPVGFSTCIMNGMHASCVALVHASPPRARASERLRSALYRGTCSRRYVRRMGALGYRSQAVRQSRL